MFIIVPKQRQPAPSAQHADADPTAPAEGSAAVAEDDRGPVRTTTACDSCRARETKCNGQRPCGPCRRKHIICVFSRPKERNLPVSPAQAALLQHQQRRLRTAVQQMASIIAKHESGIEKDPSSFDVLEQLDRYAPTEIDDQEDSDQDVTANNTLHPDTAVRPSKTRKRQRSEDTPPSTTPSDIDRTATAPMFDIIPNPQYNAGSRPPDSNEAYDTMMQFMQSMQNRSGVPNTITQQEHTMAHESNALGGNNLHPSTLAPDSLTAAAPFQQQDLAPFDFTSLIDWETSLANFQNDILPADDTWNGDFAMEPNAEIGPGNAAYANANADAFQNL